LFFQAERARLMANGDGHAPGAMDEVASMAHVDGAENQDTETNSKETRVTQAPNLSASSLDGTKTKFGFANLARFVAARWKTLDDETKSVFEGKSQLDKTRYKQELSEWKKKKERETKNAPNNVESTTTRTELIAEIISVAETPRSRAATPVDRSLSTLGPLDPPKLVTPEKRTGFLGNNRFNGTLPEGKYLFDEDATSQSTDNESIPGSSIDGFLVPNLSSTRTPASRPQPVFPMPTRPHLVLDSISSECNLHFPTDMTNPWMRPNHAFSTDTIMSPETLSGPTNLLSTSMEFPYTARFYAALSSSIVSRLALSIESQQNIECPGEHHLGVHSMVPNQATTGLSPKKTLFQFYPIDEFDVDDQFEFTEALPGVSSTADEPGSACKRVSLACGADPDSMESTDDENELLLLDPRVGMSSPFLSVEEIFEGLE
jgi:hypothetical protein